jgi:isocitrate lyase
MIDTTTKARIRREAEELERQWATDPRWRGIERPYSGEDVVRLRGSVRVEHTIARLGAQRLWELLRKRDYVAALGAMTGGPAVEMLKAGLKAIYLSGWQVAADANLAGQTYPDQSLYPANSVPHVVRRINQAFQRADQVEHAERLMYLRPHLHREHHAVLLHDLAPDAQCRPQSAAVNALRHTADHIHRAHRGHRLAQAQMARTLSATTHPSQITKDKHMDQRTRDLLNLCEPVGANVYFAPEAH